MAISEQVRGEYDRLVKAVADSPRDDDAPIAALYEFCLKHDILERADAEAYDHAPELAPEPA